MNNVVHIICKCDNEKCVKDSFKSFVDMFRILYDNKPISRKNSIKININPNTGASPRNFVIDKTNTIEQITRKFVKIFKYENHPDTKYTLERLNGQVLNTSSIIGDIVKNGDKLIIFAG